MLQNTQETAETRLEEIYYAYRKQMFCLARTLLSNDADAEDAVHTVFLQISEKRLSAVSKIQDPGDLRNYLLKATKNTCLNLLRSRRRTVALEEWMPGTTLSDSEFMEWLCIRAEAEHLRRSIDALPEHYRQVLYCRFVMELSVQDVAALTGKTVGVVKMQLSRGKKKLLQMLKGGKVPCP